MLADALKTILWWFVLVLPGLVNQLLFDSPTTTFALMFFAKRDAVGISAGVI